MRKTFLSIAVLAINLMANVALAANVQSQPTVQQIANNLQVQSINLLPRIVGFSFEDLVALCEDQPAYEKDCLQFLADANLQISWPAARSTRGATARVDAYNCEWDPNLACHLNLYYRFPSNGYIHNYRLKSVSQCVRSAIVFGYGNRVESWTWPNGGYQYVKVMIGDKSLRACGWGSCSRGFSFFCTYLDLEYDQ